MAYGRSYRSSVLDTFSLSPLPYPVLLILVVVLALLILDWSFSYEDMMEAAEEQMSLALLATPVILILAIRWLSTVENFDGNLFGWYTYNDPRRRRAYYGATQEDGGSPWGVAAVVVLLLVMVSFQSTFQDMWKF